MEPEPQTKTKLSMPFWLKAVCFASFCALVAVTVGLVFTESWLGVVDKQLKAIRDHRLEEAYTAYTSTEFKENTSLQQFANFVNRHPAFFEAEGAFFDKRSMKNNIRVLRGYLTTKQKEEIPVEYRLIDEEGEWKIFSIKFLKPRKQ